ncbi:hypothetical protein [Serratia proteamaculans]|uniref:hypothetical protein n=1 Tax=Serratia proteamaculans TaxID=28151 RepID=UPI00217AA198|nr:hypothetical protein [Serratia proteamaculans]CAI1224441.1 Uncharacterised protein [Serratia proteamaculans]
METINLKGGDAMDGYLNALAEKIGKGKLLRVGFLENSTYPDGTQTATVAAADEYGNPANNQPARPYFRNMIAERSPDWPNQMGKLILANNYDVSRSLSLMGENIKSQLQESIISLTEPKLAQSTIDRKGFDKPLIETSHMLNSADYDVKEIE